MSKIRRTEDNIFVIPAGANTVKTGQIFFEQSQSSVELTNVFPVTAQEAAAVPGNVSDKPPKTLVIS